MDPKINNKLESISNENINIISSKKKTPTIKPQILMKKGYKDIIMEKKNIFKHSPFFSHNNCSNISNNIINSNDNIIYNYNNHIKGNIYSNTNICIDSSLNINKIIGYSNEPKSLNVISNISKENLDDISEMSFGEGVVAKANSLIKSNDNRKSNILRCKMALNNNVLSSCSVDNKINFMHNKNDKKMRRSYITPIKYNDNCRVNNISLYLNPLGQIEGLPKKLKGFIIKESLFSA